MQIPEIEFATPEAIRAMQEERLRDTIQYAAHHSRFYQRMFQAQGIDPASVRTLDDLAAIPFTGKEDLNRFNDDFICVPRAAIVDYVTTSGTLGDPVTFALTDRDLDRLAYNEYISFLCAEGARDDVYQLMCTIDRRFMAGLAYFLGIRRLGAGVIRVGNGLPEMQWDTIRRIRPNVLVAVPSFLVKLIDYAEKNGIDPNASSVKRAVCIGENIRSEDFSLNNLGRKITERWSIRLFSTYASTEKATTFAECSAGRGGHHHPELIIPEIIDETGRRVGPGITGELVFTTLGVEGMPLIRYRSGDLCAYHDEPCSCGRTSIRLGPIVGRRHHMIKYRGTTIYPPAMYDILEEISGIGAYYIEVFTNDIGTDEILITITSGDDDENLEKKVKDHFRSKIRVAPGIRFQPMDVVQRRIMPEMSRKAVKFHDLRQG